MTFPLVHQLYQEELGTSSVCRNIDGAINCTNKGGLLESARPPAPRSTLVAGGRSCPHTSGGSSRAPPPRGIGRQPNPRGAPFPRQARPSQEAFNSGRSCRRTGLCACRVPPAVGGLADVPFDLQP